jgi:hypothetical protein
MNDVRSNGTLVRDDIGVELSDQQQACSRALEAMPGLLGEALQSTGTCVTAEVRSDKDTVCLIQATIVVG